MKIYKIRIANYKSNTDWWKVFKFFNSVWKIRKLNPKISLVRVRIIIGRKLMFIVVKEKSIDINNRIVNRELGFEIKITENLKEFARK